MCFFIFSKLKEITLARMFECRPLNLFLVSFQLVPVSLNDKKSFFVCTV